MNSHRETICDMYSRWLWLRLRLASVSECVDGRKQAEYKRFLAGATRASYWTARVLTTTTNGATPPLLSSTAEFWCVANLFLERGIRQGSGPETSWAKASPSCSS